MKRISSPHFEAIHPFEDGEAGVRAGLSAAKWMSMTKVSKPTATRDLAEGRVEHRGSRKTGGYFAK